MKNFLYIIALVFLVTSCASRKPLVYPGSESVPPPERAENDPRIIESVSINAGRQGETKVNKPASISSNTKSVPGLDSSTQIEISHPLQFKYAILLNEAVEDVDNAKLVSFMEEWYGKPYRYGGESKGGIDCSAFTCLLMDTVYGVTLPRTAKSQYNSSTKVKKEDLEEGDLVFFNTTGGISHVGVYLANNKFIHVSTSGGVMISDLDDAYFKKRFIGAARAR